MGLFKKSESFKSEPPKIIYAKVENIFPSPIKMGLDVNTKRYSTKLKIPFSDANGNLIECWFSLTIDAMWREFYDSKIATEFFLTEEQYEHGQLKEQKIEMLKQLLLKLEQL